MNTFWEKIFLGNSIIDWAIAISIIIGSIILLRLIKTIVFSQFKKWSKKTNTTIDDFLLLVMERSILPFFYLLAVYSG